MWSVLLKAIGDFTTVSDTAWLKDINFLHMLLKTPMGLDVMLIMWRKLRRLVVSLEILPILQPFPVLQWTSSLMLDESLISHDV